MKIDYFIAVATFWSVTSLAQPAKFTASELKAICVRPSFIPFDSSLTRDVTAPRLAVLPAVAIQSRSIDEADLIYSEEFSLNDFRRGICSNRASMINAGLQELGDEEVSFPLQLPVAQSKKFDGFSADEYSAYCVSSVIIGDGYSTDMGVTPTLIIAKTKRDVDETIPWGVVLHSQDYDPLVANFPHDRCKDDARKIEMELRELSGRKFKLTYTREEDGPNYRAWPVGI